VFKGSKTCDFVVPCVLPAFLASSLPPCLHLWLCMWTQKEFIGNHVLHVSKDAKKERQDMLWFSNLPTFPQIPSQPPQLTSPPKSSFSIQSMYPGTWPPSGSPAGPRNLQHQWSPCPTPERQRRKRWPRRRRACGRPTPQDPLDSPKRIKQPRDTWDTIFLAKECPDRPIDP
jgi:hypothetical protein